MIKRFNDNYALFFIMLGVYEIAALLGASNAWKIFVAGFVTLFFLFGKEVR